MGYSQCVLSSSDTSTDKFIIIQWGKDFIDISYIYKKYTCLFFKSVIKILGCYIMYRAHWQITQCLLIWSLTTKVARKSGFNPFNKENLFLTLFSQRKPKKNLRHPNKPVNKLKSIFNLLKIEKLTWLKKNIWRLDLPFMPRYRVKNTIIKLFLLNQTRWHIKKKKKCCWWLNYR